MANSTRYRYIDYLRAFAALFVVLLHVRGDYIEHLSATEMIGSFSWNAVNLIGAFSRHCVPLFFMISGFLTFDRFQISVKKRVGRLAIPMFVYSATYMLFGFAVFDIQPEWWMIFRGYEHLWYLPVALMVNVIAMLFLPKLKRDSVDINKGLWLCFSLFVVMSVVTNFPLSDPNSSLLFTNVFGYLMYFVLGYYLGHAKLKVSPVIAFGLYVLVSLGIAALNHHFSIVEQRSVFYFSGYTSPLLVIQSTLFFVVLKQCDVGRLPKWFDDGIKVIAKYSLGIYLIHFAFVDLMHLWLGVDATGWQMLLEIGFKFVVALVASLIVASVIRRIDTKGWLS